MADWEIKEEPVIPRSYRIGAYAALSVWLCFIAILVTLTFAACYTIIERVV